MLISFTGITIYKNRRAMRKFEWHRHFAILPVRIERSKYVWLETVERRRWSGDGYSEDRWLYRRVYKWW